VDRAKDVPRRVIRSFTTREGLVGDYDYAFLFTPKLPFMKKPTQTAPFFGLNDKMPIMLGLLLGFQHALSMLAGLITPPIILSGTGGANLPTETAQYLVSTSLIVCGILSSIQITRFHLYKSPYFIGTGIISVVGTSFATIPVALGGLSQMYASGYCPTDADGNRLACPKGYGAILGTACICALLEICLSFAPAKFLKRAFPPLVTGPTVVLIGINLIGSGFENWAGGSGSCRARPEEGIFQNCPTNFAPHPLPWGSAEFIGLGFSVFITIILCERFGSPIMYVALVLKTHVHLMLTKIGNHVLSSLVCWSVVSLQQQQAILTTPGSRVPKPPLSSGSRHFHCQYMGELNLLQHSVQTLTCT
jgi:NCS2 family nucleobase:cation symporter-2